ncbi:MAG: hypothetical protein NTZ80_04470 [Patescibacteria group bacterium]|nr:hypothetical protein [Patescibacteria group bacterium]
MNIPSLPTDNLYKFLALSGLALVILPTFLVARSVDTLNNEVDLIQIESSGVSFEAKLLETEAAELHED